MRINAMQMTNISTKLLYMSRASPVAHFPTANAGVTGLLRGSEDIAGEGNGHPFQFSCLEIPWMWEPGGYVPWGCKSWRQLSN